MIKTKEEIIKFYKDAFKGYTLVFSLDGGKEMPDKEGYVFNERLLVDIYCKNAPWKGEFLQRIAFDAKNLDKNFIVQYIENEDIELRKQNSEKILE